VASVNCIVVHIFTSGLADFTGLWVMQQPVYGS
jgi:hypothetical protein